MTPEQALREAIDHTRFLADHLEGRMGDGALADMRMKADEWEGALGKPSQAEARAEKAEKGLQEMVKKAADKSLEGYRDMGRRLADSEERAERAEKRRREIDDEAFEYSEQVEALTVENLRFRSALQRIAHGNVLNRECPGIALNALAPPSGEQVCMCGLSESEHDDYSEPIHTFTPMDEYYASDTCEVCHGTKEVCAGENAADPDAWVQCPHCDERTPEQAQDELVREGQERGEYGDDALAALEMLHELAEAAWRGGMRSDCVNNLAGVLRLHLTASAVPEQVRRLPEGWRKVAAATRITSLSDVAEEASADIYDQCADALERAIASAPAVPDGWQPIETAPKDGTFVLVYEGSTTRRMWRAQWDESIGWMFGATSDDHIACAFFRVAPTHWMPLPAEPQHGGE